VFFERDQPFYASHRDMPGVPGMELVVYPDWASVRARAVGELAGADAAMVTSFCPDARAACPLVLDSKAGARAFYDLDTPVTLAALERGDQVSYLPLAPAGAALPHAGVLRDFDLTLSFTGGRALTALGTHLGARRTVPLYGSVDPDVHHPAAARPDLAGDLSFLGTYSEDRQDALESLFLQAADRLPGRRFVLAGAQYPQEFPWRSNVFFVRHLPPGDHAAFYASSPLTLNVTRAPMARLGFCPSGRFFEAAACGVPLLSDHWEGIESFFQPGEEVLIARDAGDTVAALELGPRTLLQIARRARERTLTEHSAAVRARELEQILEGGWNEAARCSA
jgi:spore maturation protein CgeB